MIFKLFKKLTHRRLRIERRKREADLQRQRPQSPSGDDTYIVAYPKSGGTWFSFLVANINLQLNHLPIQATWWNLREYVFAVQKNRNLPPNPFSIPHGRFIHTHSYYNHTYQRVIYIVRDPRDVFISYYDMALKAGAFNGTFDEFLNSEHFGITAWIRHMEDWVCHHAALSYIQFIRYEDLKRDPIKVLSHIYQNYGVAIEQSVLENAVQRSSFSAMRAMEAEYRQRSYDLGSTFRFVRKGVVGGFSDELSPSQIALIEERCSKWMQVFNYTTSNHPPEPQTAHLNKELAISNGHHPHRD